MQIEDLANAGEGVGKIDGFTVFVEGALPQEEIEVLIVKVKKAVCLRKTAKNHYAIAKKNRASM